MAIAGDVLVGAVVWFLAAGMLLPTNPQNGAAQPVPPPCAPLRAVERPDHDGAYNCSFMIEPFKGSTKTYYINLKIFYPALAAGENGSANASGAPYPTILQMPYAGSDEGAYDFISPRIVSWGFVCVVVGTNQSDGALQSGNIQDINDILDQLERDNVTPGHNLLGMVDRGAFGIAGHSYGGRQSLIDGCYVPRLKAVQAMAPAIYQGEVNAIAPVFRKPVQIQVGRLDTGIFEISQGAYDAFLAPKALVDLPAGHGGPFLWDLAIAFFFHHLRGLAAYETFLYGSAALDDASNLTYFLNFTLTSGSFFPPRIDIGASAFSPAEDSTVDFNSSIAGYLPLGRPNCTFDWDLDGDGAPDAGGPYEMTANRSYPQARQVRVTLWYMMGKLRLDANNTLVLEVTNIPPVVERGGDRMAAEDEEIILNGSGSDTTSDLAFLNYSWDFGDGASTPFCPSPETLHAFRKSGNFTVRLTVRDDDGAEGNDSICLTVRNLAPAASAAGDMTVWKDSEAIFTGSGNDTPSDIPLLEYRWDFGDGAFSDWSSASKTTHSYTRSGVFKAIFFVRDDDGASASSLFNVTVNDAPPSAWVLLPPDSTGFLKDEEVEFGGGATDTASDARSLSFCWDFGDGNRTPWGADSSSVHKFTRGGRYTAVLRARDPEGAVGNATVNITVRNEPPTARLLSPLASSFTEDEEVRFAAEADDTESDRPFLIYTWEVDGVNHSGRDIRLSFFEEGAHKFTLTVRDTEGAAATIRGSFSISNPAPRLSASVEPLRMTAGGMVNFSACATDTASDVDNLTFLWTFGDGTRSTGPRGGHEYDWPGDYTVKLTVEDDEGATVSQSFTVSVDARPPTPPPATAQPSASNLSPYIIIGAACAAAAALTAFALLRRRTGKGAP
jgi:PKD repeat protein